MRKTKIENEGDLCRNCDNPVIKRISEFNEKKLEKRYFYTAYYWCKKCNTFYMHEKFKVFTDGLKGISKVITSNYETKFIKKKKLKQKNNKLKKIKDSKDYIKYLKSNHWKARKKQFWENHKKICFCCNRVAEQIHHCDYSRLGREKDSDLVPLCRSCHEYITEMVYRGDMKLKEAHLIYQKILCLQLEN